MPSLLASARVSRLDEPGRMEEILARREEARDDEARPHVGTGASSSEAFAASEPPPPPLPSLAPLRSDETRSD